MLTEADILEALRVCYDPELRINIVDLGRVEAIQVARDAEAPGVDPRAQVLVKLLARNEEQDAMLSAIVTNRLLGMREISRVSVEFLNTPAWSANRMTPEAKRELSKQRGLVQLGGAF
jgi:metal-sulfur cluster biosynthetic enzyme